MGCASSAPVAPPPPPAQPSPLRRRHLRRRHAPAPLPTRMSSSQGPPADVLTRLATAGTVVPDEKAGPYDASMYHANIVGVDRGYKMRGGDAAWRQANETAFAKETSWASVDFDNNGVDPDWMFSYGAIGGFGVVMDKLRPAVVAAQHAMVEQYGAAFERARAKPGAAAAFARIEQLEEKNGKAPQPGGAGLDILGLYRGALGALPALWDLGLEVVAASGEEGAALSWRVKKPRRIWFKLATKYEGNVSLVTDCAAISIVFTSAEAMARAATLVRERAATFKNRVKNPTEEGYRDLMYTVRSTPGGHVCEVQLHLKEMMDAKKSGAGHKMYKVCRRVLANPVVEVDTYCLAIEGKKPVGVGPYVDGEREGWGIMVFATGDVYEGEWKAGKREGKGTFRYATGDVYEGEWKAGKKEGKGTFCFASGNVYEGEWKADMKEGKGTYRFASGNVYEGEHKADKREGKGTFRFANGDVYEGEWKADKREGKGTFRFASGNVEVGRYAADAGVGEGAKWSADRRQAWRLRDGKRVEEISLDEAARIAAVVGLPVPS